MNFGEALEALKHGEKVLRRGWNGKGMFLWLKPATVIKEEWCKDPILKEIAHENGGEIKALGTICMKTADNKILTGWVASQTDMLTDDWELINWQEQKFKDFDLPWLTEEENVNWDEISDEEKTDYADVEELSDDADDRWNAAMEKLDKKVTDILNPDYKKPEDAISDIFDSDNIKDKLQQIREEMKIPEPGEEVKEAIKEKYGE